ncbi:MAG: hypothetical protein IPJ79_02490 [Bacteroidetes bacterium]|nr:hypothetical protein [Bacteroidota bacterium]
MSGNEGGSLGGSGIVCNYSSTINMMNCTVADNSAAVPMASTVSCQWFSL